MLPEIAQFGKWLRRKSPQASTHVHYTNDLRLFFAWTGKPPSAITLHDVDAYIEHCRGLGHAMATINRRLAAIHTFSTDSTVREPLLLRQQPPRVRSGAASCLW